MSHSKVVLVTGVAGYWGSRVASLLASEGRYHVVGLDAEQPARTAGGLDFVLADVRNPLLGELLRSEAVDTVCHLDFVGATHRSEKNFDANVMGTAKLLSACAQAGVRKVILKSSTMVYGAQPTNPAFLPEDYSLRPSRRYGYVRDLYEIEKFCNGFCGRVPEMVLTLLRFANIVGAEAHTPMTAFLRGTWAPSLMGFDPLMQIIHEDDAVRGLVHAIDNDVPGAYNIAAGDALPLSRIRGLVGKSHLSVFHSFAYWGVTLSGAARRDTERYLPFEPDYLRYPWVGDLTRMRDEMGFSPRYTADETLREFAAELRLGRYKTGAVSLAHDEQHLQDIIDRRSLARERRAQAVTGQGGDCD